MHSFEVHSNESACRKSGRLGLEQVECTSPDSPIEMSNSFVGSNFHILLYFTPIL